MFLLLPQAKLSIGNTIDAKYIAITLLCTELKVAAAHTRVLS
jgi:hypothetical protein